MPAYDYFKKKFQILPAIGHFFLILQSNHCVTIICWFQSVKKNLTLFNFNVHYFSMNVLFNTWAHRLWSLCNYVLNPLNNLFQIV